MKDDVCLLVSLCFVHRSDFLNRSSFVHPLFSFIETGGVFNSTIELHFDGRRRREWFWILVGEWMAPTRRGFQLVAIVALFFSLVFISFIFIWVFFSFFFFSLVLLKQFEFRYAEKLWSPTAFACRFIPIFLWLDIEIETLEKLFDCFNLLK